MFAISQKALPDNRLIIILIFWSSYGISNSFGQSNTPDSLHIFYDRNLNPITVGKIIDISNKTATVEDGLNKSVDIPLNKLSRQSLAQAKNILNSKVVEQEKRRTIGHLVKTLSQLRGKKLKRTLNSIAECGISVEGAAELIAPIALKSKDAELAETALLAFLAVTPVNEDAIRITDHILTENAPLRIAIALKPKSFFSSLTRFNELGELPILFSAMNGTVKLLNIDKQLIQKAEIFTTVDGSQNTIRAQATFFLSQIKTERSQKATFEIIRAAEQKINGQIDETTISAAYAGFALGGFHLSRVGSYMDFSKKYRPVLPELYDSWLKRHRSLIASEVEKQRLIQASKMRNFVDSGGNFLTRAEILKVSDGVVLFLDYKLDRRTIPLVNFSKTDQAWLLDLDL